MEREFDAGEAEQVLDPVDGLQRNAQRAAPATQWSGRWIARSCRIGGTEDRIKARCAAAQPGTDAGFIEDGRGLCDGRRWCSTMADHGQPVILLDDVSREVATGPKLDQRSGRA